MDDSSDLDTRSPRQPRALALGLAAFVVTVGSTAGLMASGATPGPTRGILRDDTVRAVAARADGATRRIERGPAPTASALSSSPVAAPQASAPAETPGAAVEMVSPPEPPDSEPAPAPSHPTPAAGTAPAPTTAAPAPAPSRARFATVRSAAPAPKPTTARSTQPAPARTTRRSPAPAPRPSTPPPDSTGISSGGDYAKIADGINAERVKAGLPALAYSETLEKAAIACSVSNAKNTSGRTIMLSHSLPGCGYEDLFMSPWSYPTAEQVVDCWMNSPGHRAAIMNRGTKTIAIGYAWRSGYGFVVAAAFK